MNIYTYTISAIVVILYMGGDGIVRGIRAAGHQVGCFVTTCHKCPPRPPMFERKVLQDPKQ